MQSIQLGSTQFDELFVFLNALFCPPQRVEARLLVFAEPLLFPIKKFLVAFEILLHKADFLPIGNIRRAG